MFVFKVEADDLFQACYGITNEMGGTIFYREVYFCLSYRELKLLAVGQTHKIDKTSDQ